MSTQLIPIQNKPQVYTPKKGFGMIFRPETRDQAWEMCERLSREKWVNGCFRQNPVFVGIALAFGEEFDLSPMQSLTNIGVVNGKPMVYGDMPLALARRAFPKMYYREEYLLDRVGCRVVVRRTPDDPEIEEVYDEARARAMGLWDKSGLWQADPRRMCMFRARGFALRSAFPDVMMGFITHQEAEDYSEGQEMDQPTLIEALPTPLPTDAANRVKALTAMDKAKTLDELRKAGQAFAKANPSQADREHATILFQDRMRELKGEAPAQPAPVEEATADDAPQPDDSAPAPIIAQPPSNMGRAKRALQDQVEAAFAAATKAKEEADANAAAQLGGEVQE